MEYLNQKHDVCEDFIDFLSEEPNTLVNKYSFLTPYVDLWHQVMSLCVQRKEFQKWQF